MLGDQVEGVAEGADDQHGHRQPAKPFPYAGSAHLGSMAAECNTMTKTSFLAGLIEVRSVRSVVVAAR
jgi:hypothetical protein